MLQPKKSRLSSYLHRCIKIKNSYVEKIQYIFLINNWNY